MSSFAPPYKTGTVSTDPLDDRHLVFTDAFLIPEGEPGDWILANGTIGYVASVDDNTNITLELPWTGGPLVDAPYLLIKISGLRYDPVLTQQKLREFIAMTEQAGLFVFVSGAAPDPGMGEDGQYALKTNGGPWKLWLKVAGEWQLQGIPVGTTFTGAWNNSEQYFANDQAEHAGSTYTAKVDNLGIEPGTDPDTWQLSASKGADGMHGGAIAFVQSFSSSTANSDPGDGIWHFGAATPPATPTVIRIDALDENGESLQAILASFATASSSVVKGQIRTVEISDPKRWVTFNVTGVSDMGGYFNVAGVVTSQSANPIRNAQRCVLFFTAKGDKGDQGNQGNQGYAPVLAMISDGARRVFQITDWVGGAGAKPVINKYVGVTGLVDAIADAIDFRGIQGLKGDTGPQGQGIQFNDNGTTAGRAIHDGEPKGYVYIATDVVPNMIYIKNSNATADWSSGSPIGGAGDMLKADNLAGLASYASARDNLGLGDLATMDKAELDDPFVTAIIFGG